jgi:DNA-directed RNA polymerase omega subunit
MKSKDITSLFKKPAPLKYQADAIKPYKAKVDSFIAEDVEESLKVFDGNRFQMIIVAAARTRDLNRGVLPLIPTKSKSGVTALLEIAAGKVKLNYTHKTRK